MHIRYNCENELKVCYKLNLEYQCLDISTDRDMHASKTFLKARQPK